MELYIPVNLLMQKLDHEIELSYQEKEVAHNDVERAHNNGEIQEANRIKSFIRENMVSSALIKEQANDKKNV